MRILITIGLLALNPWLWAKFLTEDGRIDPPVRAVIVGVGYIAVLGLGLLLLFQRERLVGHVRRRRKRYLMSLASTVFWLVVLEVGLALVWPRLQPNCHHYESLEFSVDACENSRGFRGGEFTPAKREGMKRALLIGDSFVYGVTVDEHETIAAGVQSALNRERNEWEVYNLGMPGASTFDYVTIAEEARDLEADVVVLCIYVDNDLKPTPHSDTRSWPPRLWKLFESGVNQLVARCAHPWVRDLPRVEPRFIELACEGMVSPYLLSRAVKANTEHEYYDELTRRFSAEPVFGQNILEVQQSFPESRFLVALIPAKTQVSSEVFDRLRDVGYRFANDEPVDARLQGAMESFLRGKGIACLDLLPSLQRTRKSCACAVYNELDDHFNANGNRAAAQAIAEHLRVTP